MLPRTILFYYTVKNDVALSVASCNIVVQSAIKMICTKLNVIFKIYYGICTLSENSNQPGPI